ncbi:hypothetical protein ACIXTT_22115, partial [Bacteroides fragilis]
AHGVRTRPDGACDKGDDGASRRRQVHGGHVGGVGIQRIRRAHPCGKLTGSRHGTVIRQDRACRRDKSHRRENGNG